MERGNTESKEETETLASSLSEDWQTSIKTKKGKWSYVFENEIFTDVILRVGEEEEEIRCHRIILIMSSPFFESTLSERWKSDSDVIRLPEIDPTIFRIILKFLYTDEFEIPEPSLKICMSILRLANVYLMSSLRVKCVQHFLNTEHLINEDNALQVFEEAVLLSESALEKIALHIVGRNAEKILSSVEFLNLSHGNLCRFLKITDLSIPEIELFQAVYNWAEAECCRLKLSTTSENIRLVLKKALYLIRFPIIGSDDFATRVEKTGILSLEEEVEIQAFFSMSKDERKKIGQIGNFETTRRITYNTLKRFEGIGEDSFDYSTNWRNLVFSVSRPITIYSLGFYGPDAAALTEAGSLNYNVKVNLYEDWPHGDWRLNKLCARVDETVQIDESNEIFYVEFLDPVNILENTQYVISFMLVGPKTRTGDTIRDVITVEYGCEKVSFTFGEAKYKNNRYQVPEICFALE